ncbi:DUF7822 domain-containing protein [Streptomyces sp. NPDC001732]
MANRSYLYSTSTPPTADSNPKKIQCVSEHNWSIPLAHQLLVGRGTTTVPSMIWNLRIGVAADFAGGAALLGDLLRVVGRGLEDDSDFAECVARTTAHLEKQRDQFFVLETGEIVSLQDEDPEEEVAALVSREIPDAVARAEAAIAGNDDAWLASVRNDWRDHFASFYGDALYFSFPTE